jgi:hypothetical protein
VRRGNRRLPEEAGKPAETLIKGIQEEPQRRFADLDITGWGQQELAAALDAGILNGTTDTTIGAEQKATRAESAAMLKRFLAKVGFIS